jgi:hypothetical protein
MAAQNEEHIQLIATNAEHIPQYQYPKVQAEVQYFPDYTMLVTPYETYTDLYNNAVRSSNLIILLLICNIGIQAAYIWTNVRENSMVLIYCTLANAIIGIVVVILFKCERRHLWRTFKYPMPAAPAAQP